MKTITTAATIESDGRLRMDILTELPPGHYQVVVILDETPVAQHGTTAYEDSDDTIHQDFLAAWHEAQMGVQGRPIEEFLAELSDE